MNKYSYEYDPCINCKKDYSVCNKTTPCSTCKFTAAYKQIKQLESSLAYERSSRREDRLDGYTKYPEPSFKS